MKSTSRGTRLRAALRCSIRIIIFGIQKANTNKNKRRGVSTEFFDGPVVDGGGGGGGGCSRLCEPPQLGSSAYSLFACTRSVLILQFIR